MSFSETIKSKLKDFKSNQTKGARRSLLEELFNDYYERRHQIYKMNFVRGIFFGLGTALGSGVVVAVLLWVANLIFGSSIGDWLDEFRQ